MTTMIGEGVVLRGMPWPGGNYLLVIGLTPPVSPTPTSDPLSFPSSIPEDSCGLHILAIATPQSLSPLGKHVVRTTVVFMCTEPRIVEVDGQFTVAWRLDSIDATRAHKKNARIPG
jgi:hypothetical protein